MSKATAKKAVTRKAQPKKAQPEVTPIPKRARGASKVAEAAARRPVPQPPVMLDSVDGAAATTREKARVARAASKRVSGDAIPAVVEVAKMERSARLHAGKAEHASMRAWAKDGKKGEPPATPVLDWLKENPSGSVQRRQQIRKANKSTNGTSTRGPRVACTVRYFVNGVESGEASQKLSTMAYHHTKGVSAETPDRLTASAFRAFLAAQGVTDPESSTWEVTLPNGKKVGAKLV